MPTLTYVSGGSQSWTSLSSSASISYSPTAGNLLVVDLYNYDNATNPVLGISDNGSPAGVWVCTMSRQDVVAGGDGTMQQWCCLSAGTGVTSISISSSGSHNIGQAVLSEYHTTSGYWNIDVVSLTVGGSSVSGNAFLNNVFTQASNAVIHSYFCENTSSSQTWSAVSDTTIGVSVSNGTANSVLAAGHYIITSSGTYSPEASTGVSTQWFGFAISYSVTSGAPPALGSIPTSNLVGWYMLNQGAMYDGSNGLQTLVDWSYNGNFLGSQDTGTNFIYTTNEINGLPAAVGTDATGLALNNQINCQSAMTFFFVFALSSTSSKSSFFSGTNDSITTWSCASGTGPALSGTDVTFSVQNSYGTSTADLNWHQTNITYNSSGSTVYYRKDGTADGNGTFGGDVSANQYGVGGNYGSTSWPGPTVNSENFQGAWAECIIYNAALNSTQIGEVETYLQQKYFPVASTGPGRLTLLGVGI